MKKTKEVNPESRGLRRVGKVLYTAFLTASITPMFGLQAFAADDIWTKASSIMQDVYGHIMGISMVINRSLAFVVKKTNRKIYKESTDTFKSLRP